MFSQRNKSTTKKSMDVFRYTNSVCLQLLILSIIIIIDLNVFFVIILNVTLVTLTGQLYWHIAVMLILSLSLSLSLFNSTMI